MAPVSMENITSLEPDQTISKTLEVQFNHHLLPMKLNLYCNGRKHPVKLHPDIGYFVRPLHMDIEAFTAKESQLPGMFEYMRRLVDPNRLSFHHKQQKKTESTHIFLAPIIQSIRITYFISLHS